MQTIPPQTAPPVDITVPATQAVEFPVDINTADKETLMALPGIGEVLAERILVYRTEHGPFTYAEQLLGVEGIGEKKLEELLDLITIGGKCYEDTGC